MTTFVPGSPYTDAELNVLYPKSLQLEQVQVVRMSRDDLLLSGYVRHRISKVNPRQILRHGERSPVSARFQNVYIFLPLAAPK